MTKIKKTLDPFFQKSFLNTMRNILRRCANKTPELREIRESMKKKKKTSEEKKIRLKIKNKIKKIYSEDVQLKNIKDDSKYSPIIDIPVHFVGGQLPKKPKLLRQLIKHHKDNIKKYQGLPFKKLRENKKAQYSISIELDLTGTRKQLLSGIVNASSSGRIGLSVAGKPKNVRTLVRILDYLSETMYKTNNHLIVTKKQLFDTLNTLLAKREN